MSKADTGPIHCVNCDAIVPNERHIYCEPCAIEKKNGRAHRTERCMMTPADTYEPNATMGGVSDSYFERGD